MERKLRWLNFIFRSHFSCVSIFSIILFINLKKKLSRHFIHLVIGMDVRKKETNTVVIKLLKALSAYFQASLTF